MSRHRAAAAERDRWVRRVGVTGWQAEKDRRRMARLADSPHTRRDFKAIALVSAYLGGVVIAVHCDDRRRRSTMPELTAAGWCVVLDDDPEETA